MELPKYDADFGKDPEQKVSLLLDFTDRPGEIADPWYTGNFDETYRDVLDGCEGFWHICGSRESYKTGKAIREGKL